MAAAAEVRPKQILPRIAALVLPPPPRADAAAAGARAPGCAAAEDEAMRGAARRLKGAQALSQSVLRLGATLPPPWASPGPWRRSTAARQQGRQPS